MRVADWVILRLGFVIQVPLYPPLKGKVVLRWLAESSVDQALSVDWPEESL